MAHWKDQLRIVTHPPAVAEFAIDLGPITITIDGSERDLIGGSFRGVSFYVETSTLGGGRRNVNHEFPLRNENYVDDLGKKSRTYKVEAYVLGNNYIPQRDALLDALEDKDEAGPGTLIHPFHGEKLVAVEGEFTCTETLKEGGWARFSITFRDTPKDPPFPVISLDLGSLLGAILGAIALVIAAVALVALAVVLAVLTVRALVRSVENFCDDLVSIATGFAGIFEPDDAAIYVRTIARVRARATYYARRPHELASAVSSALTTATARVPAAKKRDLMGALLAVYDFDAGPEPIRQADTFRSFTGALRRVVLLHAARAAGGAVFDSQAAAVEARDRIAALLDEQVLTATPEVYDALAEVRAELAATVPPAGSDLPQVVRYRPPVTTPSLVLAYRLYGSVDLEPDIVRRNKIRDPGFVAGVGTEGVSFDPSGGLGTDGDLEVLSRAGARGFEGGGGI